MAYSISVSTHPNPSLPLAGQAEQQKRRWLGPAGSFGQEQKQRISSSSVTYCSWLSRGPFPFEPENTFNKRVPSVTIKVTDVRKTSFCWGPQTQRPATLAIIVPLALVFDKKTRGLRICHNEESLSHCGRSRRRHWS